MKTAKEILRENVVLSEEYDKYHVLKAMREIAKLSYEAGWNRGYEYATAEDEDTIKHPPHEQFLSLLFPEQ